MDSKKLVVGIMVVNVLLGAAAYKKATAPVYEVETPVIEEPQIVKTVEIKEEVVEEEVEPTVVIEPVNTVVYRVTAYCPCEICCGKWAKKRPLDENGNPIVVGSWGVELADGYSAASPMAFGTQVELEGIGTVEVQDRTAKWVVDKYGENIIDIYMSSHQEAKEFGEQYMRGVIK